MRGERALAPRAVIKDLVAASDQHDHARDFPRRDGVGGGGGDAFERGGLRGRGDGAECQEQEADRRDRHRVSAGDATHVAILPSLIC